MKLFLPGLILSLIGIVTSWVLEAKLVLAEKTIPGGEYVARLSKNKTSAARKAGHIILVVVSLVLITVFLDKLNVGVPQGRIMFAGTIVAFLGVAAFLKQADFKDNILNYWLVDY